MRSVGKVGERVVGSGGGGMRKTQEPNHGTEKGPVGGNRDDKARRNKRAAGVPASHHIAYLLNVECAVLG